LSLCHSASQKKIISNSWDKTIKIWDIDRINSNYISIPHKKNITTLACSPDGNHLASAATDNIIKLWNVKTGKNFKTIIHNSQTHSLAYSPNSL
jgi:WD40 repeat protein